MSKIQEFHRLIVAIGKPKGAIARDLKVNWSTFLRWQNGKLEIPDGVIRELGHMVPHGQDNEQ